MRLAAGLLCSGATTTFLAGKYLGAYFHVDQFLALLTQGSTIPSRPNVAAQDIPASGAPSPNVVDIRLVRLVRVVGISLPPGFLALPAHRAIPPKVALMVGITSNLGLVLLGFGVFLIAVVVVLFARLSPAGDLAESAVPKVDLVLSGDLTSLGLVIRNDDVPGLFRLSVIDARCDDQDVGEGLPWLMTWDTGTAERHLVHGESARVALVDIDYENAIETSHGHYHAPAFQFPRMGAPAFLRGDAMPYDGPFRAQVVFEIFRVDPPAEGIRRSLTVEFKWSYDAQAKWLSERAPTRSDLSAQRVEHREIGIIDLVRDLKQAGYEPFSGPVICSCGQTFSTRREFDAHMHDAK